MTSDRYRKGEAIQLSEHFNTSEFDCPCSYCDFTLIDARLVRRLEVLRAIIGQPIRINSGYRCDRHQMDLKLKGYETAEGISTHQLGLAADIRSHGLSGDEIEAYARKAGFKAVGIACTWAHVDVRSDKDRAWKYLKRI